jgi:endoglycosylceramidase
MPKKDQVNSTYLQLLEDMVNMGGKYNVFTLLDAHQDLFSERFCADGAPLWVIPKQISRTFALPLDRKIYQVDEKTGLPKWQDCSRHPWGAYYATFAVSSAFQALYKNKHHMREEFVKFWVEAAKQFKQNKFVIGYELINEPWAGNIY